MPINKVIFKKYSSLCIEIKQLEALKKDIASQCLDEMEKEKAKQVRSDEGVFSIMIRKSWEYTAEVTMIEGKLKARKTKEQAEGLAKAEEIPTLRFQAGEED